jgi:exodeoxyribonuclease V alpha subunit
VLAAPTGRAAKRLAELAGHDAATIHRLLQLRPGGDHGADSRHRGAFLVGDSSMQQVAAAPLHGRRGVNRGAHGYSR